MAIIEGGRKVSVVSNIEGRPVGLEFRFIAAGDYRKVLFFKSGPVFECQGITVDGEAREVVFVSGQAELAALSVRYVDIAVTSQPGKQRLPLFKVGEVSAQDPGGAGTQDIIGKTVHSLYQSSQGEIIIAFTDGTSFSLSEYQMQLESESLEAQERATFERLRAKYMRGEP